MPKPSEEKKSLTAVLSKLTALHRADGIAEIVAIGASAIPALKEILFEREPSGLHQVRCRAAEALGLLGAFDVLDEFLRRPQATDPVERLGDDVVVGAAARAIARRKDERTFGLLCELAGKHPLNGVIAALVSFQRPEIIPILVNALGEDEVRLAAETALGSFGSVARHDLLETADRFDAGNDLSESRLRKYRSMLSLLGETWLTSEDVDRLRPLMTHADVQVSLLACRIALRCGSKRARSEAHSRLRYLRQRAPWPEQLEIDQYLALDKAR